MHTSISPPSSVSSPNLLNIGSPMAPGDDTRFQPYPYTPSRTPGTRRISQPRQSSDAVLKPSANSPLKSSSPSAAIANGCEPNDTASTDGENSPWCGAVGRATLGKSGRVIDRLMADIDKLKRELNTEISHRQEIEKREGMGKSVLEALRTENEHLTQAKEIDATVLKRRDRKIEEMRVEVEGERERRLRAEETAREAVREREEAVEAATREVGEARERAGLASGHAEVLGRSHRQLGVEYRQRAQRFTKDLQKVEEEREEERQKMKRLDVVVEQLRQEIERSSKINGSMGKSFEAYKEDCEGRIQRLRAEAKARDTDNAALREEAQRVVGEARWLIKLGKNANEGNGYSI